MIFTKWKHSSSVVLGVDHVEAKKPCQDNVYTKKEKGVYVIALSDGAGSKEYSQIGSFTATQSVCEYLIEEFDRLYIINETYSKTNDEIFESQKVIRSSIFNHVKKSLLEKVEDEIEFTDLACTLMFFAIKEDRYIMGHIGDGVIGALYGYGQNETIRVLSHPENGEQINITFFLTDPEAENHLRIECGKMNSISGIILMSDGPEEVLYHPVNGLHENCKKLFYNFNSYTEEEYNHILEKFLKTQIAKYSYDDLSINILYFSQVDSKNITQGIRDDLFKDITSTEQIIKRSSYSYYLDNLNQYSKVDDISQYRSM